MPFNTPFINLSIGPLEYIKLLENFDYYMEQELFLEKDRDIFKSQFPCGYIGEKENKLIINYTHYNSFEKAKFDWERRKKRINKNNIFVKFHLENSSEELACRFDQLPFKKKVCFSPKRLEYCSSAYIPRYIWYWESNSIQAITNFPTFLRERNYYQKTINIFQLLSEGKDFLREDGF